MQNSDWIKANELVKTRDWSAALEAFERAFDALSNNPDFIHDRAVCLFNLGEQKTALKELNRAVELQPDYSYRYASRAYIRNALKDIHGAIADYQKALELDPDDAISLNNLGMLEEQLGYKAAASERYRMADELDEILRERGIMNMQEEEARIKNQTLTSGREAEPQHPQSTETSVAGEIGKVFSSKKAFSEFVAFVRNGFKLESPKQNQQRDDLS